MYGCGRLGKRLDEMWFNHWRGAVRGGPPRSKRYEKLQYNALHASQSCVLGKRRIRRIVLGTSRLLTWLTWYIDPDKFHHAFENAEWPTFVLSGLRLDGNENRLAGDQETCSRNTWPVGLIPTDSYTTSVSEAQEIKRYSLDSYRIWLRVHQQIFRCLETNLEHNDRCRYSNDEGHHPECKHKRLGGIGMEWALWADVGLHDPATHRPFAP